MRWAIILAICLVCPVAGYSTTWYVDDDAPNDPGPNDPTFSDPMEDGTSVHPFDMIQEGIDAASNGDTVLVLSGKYKENINFLGKLISVESQWGPELTVLDGNGTGSAALFNSNENPDAVLKGFTIKNGTGTTIGTDVYGGGICCINASPTIKGNIITKNKAMFGGGICCEHHCDPVIKSNVVFSNNADASGGSGGLGGGFYFYKECKPVIVNNMLYANMAGHSGGGIYAYDSDMILTNNTICINAAATVGGGLHNVLDVAPHQSEIYNTIFWHNDAQAGLEIHNSGVLDILYSDLPSAAPPDVVNMAGGFVNWGAGMIYLAPNFVDLNGGDLHIRYPSPCRDAGTNAAPALPNHDFEGDPRIVNEVDIGADEFFRHLYYTGQSVPGGSVEMKIVDEPGTNPVGLYMSAAVLGSYIPTIYGNWWLVFPWTGPIMLGTIPGSGVMILPGTLPFAPGPYEIYFQSLQGNPLKLTNLCIMHVD